MFKLEFFRYESSFVLSFGVLVLAYLFYLYLICFHFEELSLPKLSQKNMDHPKNCIGGWEK